jgi:hypothetical protein
MACGSTGGAPSAQVYCYQFRAGDCRHQSQHTSGSARQARGPTARRHAWPNCTYESEVVVVAMHCHPLTH